MAKPGGGFCGVPVEVGDFNDDGIQDYAVAPILADSGPGSSRQEAGEIVIFAGSGAISGAIDLQSPPPGQPLLTVFGAAAFDLAGTEIHAADLTGDGIDDLLIGASGANANGQTNAGAAYLIRGGPALGGVIDLAAPPASVTTFLGPDGTDRLGFWVEAGDIDGDGRDELIASAALNRAVAARTGSAIAGGDGPGDGRLEAGDTYIIWGAANLPAVIDLSNPIPLLAANELTIVYGADVGDVLGEELTSGNFDGDAFNDLVLGALTGDGFNNSVPSAGDAAVIYGTPQLRGRVIDTVDPTVTFVGTVSATTSFVIEP